MAQININKLFVSVPAGNEAAALVASTNAGNVKKIYFFADGRIVNNGKEYSIATEDYAAVKAAVTKLDGAETVTGSVLNLIKKAKDELNGTISGVDTRVTAIETLIGSAQEDGDAIINTVKEVLDWFAGVQETNTVLGRILELEDETAHIAYHESHPETSVWGTFGIMTSCGYKSGSCVS